MTVKVASVPWAVTAFSIADLWVLVNIGEPNANLDDTRTDSFSLAVATEPVVKPQRAITKLVIKIVTSVENLRMFNNTFN